VFAPPGARFSVGLMGAVLIGWAIAIFGIVDVAPQAGAKIWHWLTLSMVVWFIIDSAISWTNGFRLNLVTNGVFVLTYFVPLFASGVLGRKTALS
jgi:hypothetical protein